jgi:hypothetical protein
MSELKSQITKLNKTNYSSWVYIMERLLRKDGLWKYCTEEPPAERKDDWIKKDAEAHLTISLAVEQSQMKHIKKSTTAKEAWDALKSYHLKSSLSVKVSLMKQLCNQKYDEMTTMEDHINGMSDVFQKLSDIGEELSESWSIAFLLCSLPESYDTIIMTLEARADDELTMSLVETKLVDEWRRRSGRDDEVNAVLKPGSHLKKKFAGKKFRCHSCGSPDHFRKHCPKLKERHDSGKSSKANLVSNADDEENFLFSTGSVKNGWLLDSGATCHIANQKEMFCDLDLSHREKVNVADGKTIMSAGKGTIPITFVNAEGKEFSGKIENVLLVPEIKGNFLSVKRLSCKGLKLIFDGKLCEIWRGKQQIAIADEDKGLYKLREPKIVNVMVGHKDNCAHYWHRVLGHRDLEVVRRLNDGNLVEKIPMESCELFHKCEICLQAKMTRLPFPKKSLNKSEKPLDLIHSDICGPMQTESPSGKRYFLTFIDDFSKY